MDDSSERVVVIGAGMTGIACARRLAGAGLRPLVLDKGRGIGGRLATRRANLPEGPVQFDHGAQYVTARTAAFAAELARLGADGAAAPWAGGERPRWVGLPGMSGMVRALAAGLEVRQQVEVRALREDGATWQVHTDDGIIAARRVVATVPAPQVVPLLGADHPLVPRISGVRLAPCLTLMAAFPAAAPVPPSAAEAGSDGPLAWIACDSTKPGRPRTVTQWIAQAGPDWSARHLEEDRPAIAARMLPALAERLGVAPGTALHAAAHRWRYARVTAPLGTPFLRHDGLWLGGDWCLGPRVEAAWTSGTAMADALLEGGHAA
ncbi:MAG: NAD(P)/FAD-dependent oxidoreductase [Alkalilacustris sp.]